jgi:hypothetical protein
VWVFPPRFESVLQESVGHRPPAAVNSMPLEAGKYVPVVSRDRMPRKIEKVSEGDQEVVSWSRGGIRTPDSIGIHSCSGEKTWVHNVARDVRGAVQPRCKVQLAPTPRRVLGETRRRVF